MFTPGIKYAIRIGLIVVITGLILAIFANIQIPQVDFTPITIYLGKAFAVLTHYVPIMAVVIPFMKVLIGVRLGLFAWKIASIGIKWIWKVNE